MKKRLLSFTFILLMAACERRMIASHNNTNSITKNSTDSVATVKTNASFLVVSDGFGKLINTQQTLPQNADIHFDPLLLSRGYTTQQKLNLKTRYQTIPPLVLYVDPQKQVTSARGSYYILGKKFWYWKQKDGLFHLDDKYYL